MDGCRTVLMKIGLLLCDDWIISEKCDDGEDEEKFKSLTAVGTTVAKFRPFSVFCLFIYLFVYLFICFLSVLV